MSLMYDLFENPMREGTDEPLLHARPVMTGTMTTDKVAKFLTTATSFTEGDLRGILVFIADMIPYAFGNSNKLHLDEIGTFSASLKCRKPVRNKKEVRSADVKIKSITFRPDPAMKRKLNSVKMTRVAHSVEKKKYTEEERKKRILSHIKASQSIDVTTVMTLNQCGYAKALSDLDALLAENMISCIGRGRRKIYVLNQAL